MSTTALARSSTSTSLTAPANQAKATSPSPISTAVVPKSSPAPPSALGPAKATTPNTHQQQQQQQQPRAQAVSFPGRWQHPRLDEIIQRQSRTNFDKSNVYAILWNCLFLVASFGVRPLLNTVYASPPFISFPVLTTIASRLSETTVHTIGSTPTYILLALRLLILGNISLIATPLFRQPDKCEDIPLTPSQRQLFGLPPLSRPATPQEKEQWVTPPRYARSASGTPRSSSSSLQAEVSGSPLEMSGRRSSFPASPAFMSPSGSPNSGLQTRYGGSGERRKLSYTLANRSSPLSISEFDAAGSVNTPTKANNRASVSLNNKWLYEKGKANGSAWGTGSVFL